MEEFASKEGNNWINEKIYTYHHNIYIIMYKKKLLSILLLLGGGFSISTISSQTMIDFSHNSMRMGDVVNTYRITASDIWNLSQSERYGETIYESYEDFKTETITQLFNGMRQYYVLQSDTLLCVGRENPLQKDSLYKPETYLFFPMTLGDKSEGCFATHVNYCDKMKLHKYGTFTVHADSIGDLTLPNGDVIGNILQISNKRTFLCDPYETDSLTEAPLYCDAEILQEMEAKSSETYTEVTKNLYVRGYRYPIVRDISLYTPNKILYKRETYFFPLDEQEGISLDEANQKARREQDDRNNDNGTGKPDDIFSFISNNADTHEVIFDCTRYLESHPTNDALQCQLLLSDSRGIVYQSRSFVLEASVGNDIRMSYSGLRPGQYIVSLIINNQIYTNNFIIE